MGLQEDIEKLECEIKEYVDFGFAPETICLDGHFTFEELSKITDMYKRIVEEKKKA